MNASRGLIPVASNSLVGNGKKRPRAKISFAGVTVVAPPEQGFDKSEEIPLSNPEFTLLEGNLNNAGVILPNVSLGRVASWENVPDAARGTAKKVPAEPAGRIRGTQESIEQQTRTTYNAQEIPSWSQHKQRKSGTSEAPRVTFRVEDEIIDLVAVVEEEEALMRQLDDDISRAEEEEIMKNLEREIIREETMAMQKEAEGANQRTSAQIAVIPNVVESRVTSPSPRRLIRISETYLRTPKFCGIVFTEKEFQTNFVDVFRRQVAERKKPSNLETFQVSLRVAPQEFYYEMVADMDESLEADFRKKARDWTNYRVRKAKLKAVLDDPQSLVFDITMKWNDLGVTLEDLDAMVLPEQRLPADEGFRIRFKAKGQLMRIFGTDPTTLAIAILAVDGKQFENLPDLRAYVDQSCIANAFVKVTFCAHNKADLWSGDGPVPELRRLGDQRKGYRTITAARDLEQSAPNVGREPSRKRAENSRQGYDLVDEVPSGPSPMGHIESDAGKEQTLQASSSWKQTSTDDNMIKEWQLSLESRGGGKAFTKGDFEVDFLAAFCRKVEERNPTTAKNLKVMLKDLSTTAISVVARGPAGLITELKHASEAWARRRGGLVELERLLADGDSMVFDYLAHPDNFGLAFDVEGSALISKAECNGVLVSLGTQRKGILLDVFGPSIASVSLAVIATEGSVVSSPVDLKRFLDQKQKDDCIVKLTFCLQQDVDLSIAPGQIPEIRRMRFCGADGQLISAEDDTLLEEDPLSCHHDISIPSSCPRTLDEIEDVTKMIIRSGDSVEVDLWMDVSASLGAGLHDPPKSSGHIWLHMIQVEGHLSQVLGKEFGTWGAVLLAVNGVVIRSIAQFERMQARFGDRNRYQITLVFLDGVDLKDVDRSRLVRPPRRRNGNIYPMHLSQRTRQPAGGTSNPTNASSGADVLEAPANVVSKITPPSSAPTMKVQLDEAIEKIMNSERSIEVAVLMPVKESLGAKLFAGKEYGLLHSLSEEGNLFRTFGTKCGKHGMVLLELNGVKVRTANEVKSEKEKCTTEYYRLRVACSDGVDLNAIDRSRLVHPPRRRNGESYGVHLGLNDNHPGTVSGAPIHEKERLGQTTSHITPPKSVIESRRSSEPSKITALAIADKVPRELSSKALVPPKEKISIIVPRMFITPDGERHVFLDRERFDGEFFESIFRRKVVDPSMLESFQYSLREDQTPMSGGTSYVVIAEGEPMLIDIWKQNLNEWAADIEKNALLDVTSCNGRDINQEASGVDLHSGASRSSIQESCTRHSPSSNVSRPNEEDADSFLEWPPVHFTKTSALPESVPANDEEYGEAIKRIVGSPRSVRLVLLVPSEGSLGARLFFDGTILGHGWLFDFKPGQALSKICGDAFGNWGVVVESVNGVRVRCTNDFLEQKKKKGDLELCLICFDGVDLSSVDRSRISKCPRRLDGTKYPLNLTRKHDADPGIVAKTKPDRQPDLEAHNLDPDAWMESRVPKRRKTNARPTEKGIVEAETRTEEAAEAIAKEVGKDASACSLVSREVYHMDSVSSSQGHNARTPASEPENQHTRRTTAVLPVQMSSNHNKYNDADKQNARENISSSQNGEVGAASKNDSRKIVALVGESGTDRDLRDVDYFPTADDDHDARSTLNKTGDSLVPSTRKRRLSEPNLSDRLPRLPKKQQSASVIESKAPGGAAPNHTQVVTYDEFVKVFDGSKPLGGYFIEEFVNNVKRSKVHSIAPGGQMDLDKRIRQGTIVEIIYIGTHMEEVRNLAYLRRKYMLANELKRPFKLGLVTPSHDPKMVHAAAVDKHWTHDGCWAGEDLNGWDGRVPNRRPEKQTTTGNRSPTADRSLIQKPVVKRGSASSASVPKVAPNLSLRPRQMTSGKSTEVEEPLERRRSVSFGASRVVIIDSRSGDVPSMSDRPAQYELSSYDRFWNAVKHQTCKDLIKALEDGGSQDAHVITNGLREGYAAVKEMLDRVEGDIGFRPMDKNLLQQQKDLVDKKKVLSIYTNASLLLEKAFNLQHWASFELRLVHADFRLTDDAWRGLPTKAKVSAEITTAVKGETRNREKLGELEAQELREFMLFEESTAVKFNNNHKLLVESRQIQIDFFVSGSSQRKNGQSPLASFVLPLNQINDRCQTYDHPARIRIYVLTPNYQVKSAEVTVEAKRIRLDRSYTELKARDVFKGLTDQMEQIKRFNMDHKGELEIGPNVRGRDGGSFINAAITLVKPALIDKLRDLDYRFPSNSGDASDPLVRAKTIRDRAREKLDQKLKVSNMDPNAIRAVEDRVKELDEMVATLTKMSYSPQAKNNNK